MGCRERTDRTELVRVVAVEHEDLVVLVPDLRRSAAGRGAHLHPRTRCLELAEKRRAFGRALRLRTAYDLTVVRHLVTTLEHRTDPGR